MTKELSIDEMMELAGEMEDQSQEVTGGDFDNTPEEGVTVGRLISYVELGKHDGGSYQGKKKPDASKVRLEFELLGPNNIIKWEKDGVEQEAGQVVSVTIKHSLSDKSSFKKIWKKLSYGRTDKNHIAKMLGEAFIIHIYHNVVDKDGKKRTYVNLHKDGEFGISAPFQVDPITKQKSYYDIRPATQPLRLFLWDRPQQSMWDSLFIDGTREVKTKDDKGVETTTNVSKNWLQEMILSAKNYAGSKLQALLNNVGDLPVTEEAAKEQEAPAVQQEQQQVKTEVKPEAAPAEEQKVEQPADPLAALGLKMK